jgi:hypothetical protein
MICGWCEQEMNAAATVTCTANDSVTYPDGSSLPPVPFVPAPLISEEEWWAEWRKVRQRSDTEEAARKRHNQYKVGWNRCHDCNVLAGGRHHPGCDNERCPRCSGQLISCSCLDDEEDQEATP